MTVISEQVFDREIRDLVTKEYLQSELRRQTIWVIGTMIAMTGIFATIVSMLKLFS